MKDFLLVSVHRPAERFERMFVHKKKTRNAFFLLILLGVLYTFTVIIGYRNGFGAVVKPFINIPPEEYYYYEAFFGIPVYIVIAIVFAGGTRLLALSMGGRGSFENNFVVYCTSSIIPTLITMWLPETILIVFFPDMRAEPLGGFKIFPVWFDVSRQVIGVVWPMIISITGIHTSEKISPVKSSIITLLVFLVCAALMVIFIR